MILAHFRVAIAWVLKQPYYYAVKVGGLAIGVMCAALLLAYVEVVDSYDSHIANREHIYRVMGDGTSRETGQRIIYDFGSNAWIEPFKREYEGRYDSLGLLFERRMVLSYETSAYDEDIGFVDRAALPLLGIELLQGDSASAMEGPNKVMLSESAAVKYFGSSEDVIGKTLTLNKEHYLAVTGVFKDLPPASNYAFDVLVSYATTERFLSPTILSNTLWILFTRHTMLVTFNDDEQAKFVDQDLRQLPFRRSSEQHIPILERNKFALWLQPLSDIYLNPLTGGTDGQDFTRRNTYLGIWILSSLVLLGACVNYISLTLGQLQLRLKELGVRTSFGATKPLLAGQLIAESLIVSMPAILLSIQLVYLVAPLFASVVGVPLSAADVLTFDIWGGLALSIMVLAALVSAGPVLFAGKHSLKGDAGKTALTKLGWRAGSTVVFFQFAISTLAALMVLGIYLQISYLRNVGAGFDTDDLLMADMKYQGADANVGSFEAFKNDLLQLPAVESVAAISVTPPSTGSFTNWQRLGDAEPVEHTISHIQVDPNFLSTYRINLLAGRNFSLDAPSELFSTSNETAENVGILLTESAVRRFGIATPEEAIGQRFRYSMFDDKRSYVVIGIIEDFKFSPMESEINSIAILQGSAEPLRTLSVRTNDSYDASTAATIKELWSKHMPGVPFNLTFMEDVIDAEIRDRTESIGLAVSMASIVFFCTAIIGIYAQASFVCDRSAKSIAIRKVLGSSIDAILGMLLLRFTLPVVLSFLLALPIAIYFISTFYSSFQETPGFPVYLYVLCLLGIAAIALLTILAHCRKAAARHPIHTLRYE